jgi:hypothetical protein
MALKMVMSDALAAIDKEIERLEKLKLELERLDGQVETTETAPKPKRGRKPKAKPGLPTDGI